MLGVGLVVLAFIVGLFSALSVLLAANRRLLEENLSRTRRLERMLAARDPSLRAGIPGLVSTQAKPWA